MMTMAMALPMPMMLGMMRMSPQGRLKMQSHHHSEMPLRCRPSPGGRAIYYTWNVVLSERAS
ncbi:hypothetical protein M5D96_009064 [Drosophila gunungcola]|uniref:Uncharacterized protein n=1 Tax=Drosophila gunungcola TaxID=103775 RepID=A0A9P9YJR2_9MUSC|nr:hypothetical protein M5D96_009064 [Drosophila gunungcola]